MFLGFFHKILFKFGQRGCECATCPSMFVIAKKIVGDNQI